MGRAAQAKRGCQLAQEQVVLGPDTLANRHDTCCANSHIFVEFDCVYPSNAVFYCFMFFIIYIKYKDFEGSLVEKPSIKNKNRIVLFSLE